MRSTLFLRQAAIAGAESHSLAGATINHLRISIHDDESIDELLSLKRELVEAEWAASVVEVRERAGQRHLGDLLVALDLFIAPGGAVAVLASVLITWLRTRRSRITVVVAHDTNHRIEISTESMSVRLEEVGRVAAELAALLEGDRDGPGGG